MYYNLLIMSIKVNKSVRVMFLFCILADTTSVKVRVNSHLRFFRHELLRELLHEPFFAL